VSEPTASPEPAASAPGSTRTGPGRVLIAIYALFALAASARAGVQIATKFGHAPVAYLLSAFAGVVYILATVTLAVGSPTARRIAVLSCSVELTGVLAVGTWSLADPATFPDASVWSGYGSGYGFVPLVLPVFGLLWLRRLTGRARTRRTVVPSARDAGEAADGGAYHGEGGGPGQGAGDVVADGRTQRTCPAGSHNPHPHRDPLPVCAFGPRCRLRSIARKQERLTSR
jgi:hypothetical protein